MLSSIALTGGMPTSMMDHDDQDLNGPRPLSPSTTSTFSITTTMEYRVFREDAGRTYQATNDEYSLPADEDELDRLNTQHKALKVMQNNRNYLAPIDQALRPQEGEERRLLDVGTGSGIWAIEMAEEFPHVQVTGIDLSPVQYQHDIPDNCHFAHEDASEGLRYPDEHFDVVHLRALIAGIRDWEAMVIEALRVLKKGGLVAFVDMGGELTMYNSSEEEAERIAPDFMAFSKGVGRAFDIRGMSYKGIVEIVPNALKARDDTRDAKIVPMPVPLCPWSDDPLWRQVGKIMLPDAKAIPATARLLVVDALSLDAAEYDRISAGYIKALDDGVHGIVPLCHVWAWKL